MSTLTTTSHSTLMEDYLGGSPVTHDGPITATADADGNNMVFGVDSDGHIRCITPQAGSPTGWTSTDLEAGLPAGIVPRLLAATRRHDGVVTLAVAARDAGGADHVYETSDFTAAAPNRWTDRGTRAGVAIDAIAIGYDASGAALIVVTTQAGTDITNYLLNPDSTDTTSDWKAIPCPFNSTGVLATAVGHIPSLESDPQLGIGAAVYSLHTMTGGETAMVVTSVPTFTFNHQVVLTAPTAFDLGRDASGAPVLVAALPSGAGSQLVTLDQASQLQKDPGKVTVSPIGQPTTAPIDRILVTSSGTGTIDAWAHDTSDTISHAAHDGDGWGNLLGFAQRIGGEAAWTDPSSGTVDVYFVDLDNQLSWYRQDATTTRWKQHTVRLSDLTTCTPTNSYTTRITVTAADGTPAGSEPMTLTTSERTVVTVNGDAYDVGPGRPASVSTSGSGVLTIVDHVTGVSAPTVTLVGDRIGTVTIDPMDDLKQQVGGLSQDDIQHAQMATDSYATTEPMLPSAPADHVAAAHQAVQMLVAHAAKLPSSGGQTTVAASAAAPQVAVAPPARWALSMAHTGPRLVTDAAELDAIGSVGSGILDAFGDLWHAVKHGFVEIADVAHIVVSEVEQGLEVAVHGLGQAFTAVVQFAEQVWDVVETVFKIIGAAFADLVRWLGFIFRWKDILNTHQVVHTAAKHGLDQIAATIRDGKPAVAAAAKWVDDQVLGKQLENEIAAIGSHGLSSTAGGQTNETLQRPESAWGLHHFATDRTLDSGNSSGGGVDPSPIATVIDNELADVKDTIQKLGTVLFKDPGSRTIGQTAEEVLGIIAEGLVDAVEQAALGLLDFAAAAVDDLAALLDDRWDIPVITAVYETVIAPGSKLSLLDVVCLVAAIPATIAYKLAVGTAPFTQEVVDAVVATATYDDMLAALGVTSSPAFGAGAGAASFHAGAALAMVETPPTPPTTPPPPPFGARCASYAFGFVAGVSSVVYGTFNGLMVVADADRMKAVAKAGNSVKFVTGLVSAVSGLVTMSIALGYDNGRTKSLGFEMFITFYQCAFCVKDGLTWRHDPYELGLVDMAVLYDLLESVLGVLNTAFFIALAVTEGSNNNMGPGNIVKTVQNISLGIAQIGAFPADLVEDPVDKTIAAIAMTIFSDIPGVLNCARVVIDIAGNEIHVNQ